MRTNQSLLYHFLLWSGVLAYLFSLQQPLLFVTKLYFFSDAVSLLSILSTLFQQREFLLFFVIFSFVFILPLSKFTLLIMAILNSKVIKKHHRLYTWLEHIGKWAMLDVFIIALIIVMLKFGATSSASAQTGLYLFTYSIIASMVCSQMLNKAS